MFNQGAENEYKSHEYLYSSKTGMLIEPFALCGVSLESQLFQRTLAEQKDTLLPSRKQTELDSELCFVVHFTYAAEIAEYQHFKMMNMCRTWFLNKQSTTWDSPLMTYFWWNHWAKAESLNYKKQQPE